MAEEPIEFVNEKMIAKHVISEAAVGSTIIATLNCTPSTGLVFENRVAAYALRSLAQAIRKAGGVTPLRKYKKGSKAQNSSLLTALFKEVDHSLPMKIVGIYVRLLAGYAPVKPLAENQARTLKLKIVETSEGRVVRHKMTINFDVATQKKEPLWDPSADRSVNDHTYWDSHKVIK